MSLMKTYLVLYDINDIEEYYVIKKLCIDKENTIKIIKEQKEMI